MRGCRDRYEHVLRLWIERQPVDIIHVEGACRSEASPSCPNHQEFSGLVDLATRVPFIIGTYKVLSAPIPEKSAG